jgi:hypothetical protein
MYDLVWSTPIQKLAEQFGLSDRGLAKICLRHQVPVPGRGYWAKLEAGRPVQRTPLAKYENPGLEPVHVGSYRRAVNPYVAYAMEQAKGAVSATKDRKVAQPQRSNNLEIKPERGSAKAREPVVLQPVRKLHSAILQLGEQLRSQKPNEYGEISAQGVRIAPESRARVVTFIHHLVGELETRGLKVHHCERGFVAGLGPDDVRFEIVEGRRREKHVPTAAEQKRHDDYQRRREQASRRGQWLSYEQFWPEFDYVHEGKVALEINNWADGARKRWSDGRTQTLESMLEAIADGILYHVHFDQARREEREAEARRVKHLAHRRNLQERRLKREEERQAFLKQLADDQREAADLRSTIEGANRSPTETEPEYRAMIEWAKQRLQTLESRNEIEVLSAILREQNLFPDPDDLFDPEGDPPPRKNSWEP